MKHKRIEFHHVKRRYRELNLTIASFNYFRLVVGKHAFVLIVHRKRKQQ